MTALLVLALLGGGRDPLTDPPRAKPPPDEGCGEDLCRFKLEQLKLVAIVSGDSDPVAMFEDPLGKGLIAHRHSRIGRRGGKVTTITAQCVTVVEQGEKKELCIGASNEELQ